MELEDKERIVVDLLSHHIDHCGNVLAGHRPVWTRTVHAKVTPGSREHLQPVFLCDIVDGGRQLAVEQLSDNSWMREDAVHQGVGLLGRELVHLDSHRVGRSPRTLYFRIDDIVADHDFLYRAIACVAGTTRDAVSIVYVCQRAKPFASPPRFSKVTCHLSSCFLIHLLISSVALCTH